LLAAQANIDESALQLMIESVVVDRKAKQEIKLICGECKMQTPSVKEKCLYCGGKLIGDVSKSPFV
jgi:rRNA maturation endonuclease Nob1